MTNSNWMIAAGLILSAGTTGALAREPKAQPTVSPSPVEAGRPAAKEVKYCVVESVTGSRIPIRQCRTRKDWLDQGFDPLRK